MVELAHVKVPATAHDFKKTLQRIDPGLRDVHVISLKGYGSGIDSPTFHSEALQAADGFNVIVWDGDWCKKDSCTSFVSAFLAAGPLKRAVAFRKADGNLDGFLKSWGESGLLSQLILVLVRDTGLADVDSELRSLGVADADLADVTLGWLTLRATGTRKILAIGGGPTTVKEARANLLLKHDRPSWKVLNVSRTTKNGTEEPLELLKLLPELNK